MDRKETRLHIGCGDRFLEGYVNVDVRHTSCAEKVLSLEELSCIFKNVSLLYACHVVEHIAKPLVVEILASWKKMMVPGGTLRVSVPDLSKIVQLYQLGVSAWRLSGLLSGRQNYPENFHYAVYDKEMLAWTLSQAGFYDIRPWDPYTVYPDPYDDYSKAKIEGFHVSLNLEATA